MVRFMIIVIGLISFVSCATGPYPVTSPYYLIPANSILKLNQPLEIPANTGRVYLQYGKVVAHNKLDQYFPHCWFISWNISDSAITITPDSFKIIETIKYETFAAANKQLRLAMASTRFASGVNGATAMEYMTIIKIHSDKQPAIKELTCSHWEDPADATHLTLSQITRTLGKLAEIKLVNVVP